MSFALARVCTVLGAVLAAGCASGGTQQTAAVTTSALAVAPVSPPAAAQKPRPATAVTAPTWKTDRVAWCRMRERQKAAAKSSTDPIGGTTDPYLISVHDQMCQAS